jgi:hypothetical protein
MIASGMHILMIREELNGRGFLLGLEQLLLVLSFACSNILNLIFLIQMLRSSLMFVKRRCLFFSISQILHGLDFLRISHNVYKLWHGMSMDIQNRILIFFLPASYGQFIFMQFETF